jgi:CelD/BcsL family acetyltransferase involved in cellulose biosynthesis
MSTPRFSPRVAGISNLVGRRLLMLNAAPSTVIDGDEQAVERSVAPPQDRGPSAPAGRLRVNRIQELAEFAALSREWDALLQRSGERSPFLTWEWLYPWWQHMGRDGELYILTVRAPSGRLVGLAPLFRAPAGPGNWEGCRRLAFLGTGPAASDYLNLILDPQEGCVVVAALVRYLVDHRAEWDVLSLTDADEKAWALSMVRAVFQACSLDVAASLTPGSPCPYACLDGGWTSYLQSRSTHLARQFKRQHALLAKRHGARLEVVERPAEIPRALGALLALHRARRAAVGDATALDQESMVAFLRAAAPLLQERGWLRVYKLAAAGRPLAMLLGLAYRGTFYYYQSGWDVSWSAWSPGMVLQGLTIEHACREGMTEYDFLRGSESYKDRWAPHIRRTVHLEIVQRTPRTLVYRARRRLGHGLREARRRLRALGAR